MPTSPCPYCGTTPPDAASRCPSCGGLFEPLSRTATQLAMGPWQVRDEARPFMPGFNSAILARQIAAGRITADTVLRGPTTYQFWMRADQAPGVSRLLGKCHACRATVAPTATACGSCRADLSLPGEIDQLGLMYVSPQDRAAAQAEINSGQVSSAPAPAKPGKPSPQAGVEVEADALIPIDSPKAGEAEEDVDTDEPHDAIEDLWAAADDLPSSSRRRSRRGRPDGTVIGILLLSLVVLLIGAVVLIGGGNDDDAQASGSGDTDSSAISAAPAKPVITEVVVQDVRGSVNEWLEAIDPAEVPDPLRERFDAIQAQIAAGEEALAGKKYQQSHEVFLAANNELRDFVGLYTRYIEDAEVRAEATAALAELEEAKSRAMALDAQKWAAADWTRATDTAVIAAAHMEQANFNEAYDNYVTAARAYEDAERLAQDAVDAQAAQQTLFATMRSGSSREALEKHAPEELKQAIELQAAAVAAMNGREYRDALDAYARANAMLEQGNRKVELARGRRYYAFLAGYTAADTLLSVATGDPLTGEVRAALRQAMSDIQLPGELMSRIPNEETPDFDAASDILITQVREALLSTYGLEVQASFAVGVKCRIIEKTLSMDTLSADHRSTAGTTLRDLEQEAGHAGWDMATLAPKLDDFRVALRKDTVGKKPTEGPKSWAEILTFLKTRDSGLPLMTPTTIEEAPAPELFPESGN